MSYYVHDSSLSYPDYLQAASFEKALTTTLSTNTREIVASVDHLSTDSVHVLHAIEGMTAEISAGFETLQVRMDHVADAIGDLRAEFHWGFSEMLAAMGRMKDSLDQLIRLSRTPAQTWATEQFENARDALRRKLHRDALETVERAISGHDSNIGYRLDHRFHHLKGIILIGSFSNHESAIVNPPLAEAAFLDSHRYALHDLPGEAARSLVCAGWAAYVQGQVDRAHAHTAAALSLDSKLAEAYFQLAKCDMHLGRPEAAKAPLRLACSMDPEYALKSAADGDFQRHPAPLNDVLQSLRDEATHRAEAALSEASAAVERTERLEQGGYRFRDLGSLSEAHTAIASAKAHLRKRTFFDALDAEAQCALVYSHLAQSEQAFKQSSAQKASEQYQVAASRFGSAERELSGGTPQGIAGGLVVLLSLFVACQSCKDAEGFGQGLKNFFGIALIGLIVAGVLSAIVHGTLKEKVRVAAGEKADAEARQTAIAKFDPTNPKTVAARPRIRNKEAAIRSWQDLQVGGIYSGRVVSTTPFGAFVELAPDVEGLLHISELAKTRVERTEDVVKVGDTIQVQLLEVDERGRMKLSRKSLL